MPTPPQALRASSLLEGEPFLLAASPQPRLSLCHHGARTFSAEGTTRRLRALQGLGPRAKSQGPRAKGQEPRAKSQGPRAKGQGLRAKGREEKRRCGCLRPFAQWSFKSLVAGLEFPFVLTNSASFRLRRTWPRTFVSRQVLNSTGLTVASFAPQALRASSLLEGEPFLLAASPQQRRSFCHHGVRTFSAECPKSDK